MALAWYQWKAEVQLKEGHVLEVRGCEMHLEGERKLWLSFPPD